MEKTYYYRCIGCDSSHICITETDSATPPSQCLYRSDKTEFIPCDNPNVPVFTPEELQGIKDCVNHTINDYNLFKSYITLYESILSKIKNISPSENTTDVLKDTYNIKLPNNTGENEESFTPGKINSITVYSDSGRGMCISGKDIYYEISGEYINIYNCKDSVNAQLPSFTFRNYESISISRDSDPIYKQESCHFVKESQNQSG